jgi:hypothetical protein
MATNVRLEPDYEIADHAPDLSEEEASQGFKTGHMRWVLAIGFGLACVAVAGVWGGLTVKRSILLIQTLPALVGLGLWWAA